MDFYTIPQEIALVFTSLLTGSVSLLASLTIICIIWRDRKEKLKFVYHRILLAMSILDAINGFNFAFSFLAVPKGMFWGAQGNTATCEASGFFHTFFVSQGLYNFGLAIYYLMIVRYGKSQEYVSRYVEPYVHTISVSVPMAVTSWALATDGLNPLPFLGGWCFMAKYPPLCAEGECTRGAMDKVVTFVTLIGVMVPPIIGIVVVMIMIIWHVRGRIAAVVQYRTRTRLDETTRQTVYQSLLYIGASLFPSALLFVNQLLNYAVINRHQTTRFVVAFLVKLIIPLQGLFNLIIYVRPRYIALRQRRGDSLSFFTMMKCIVVGEGSAAIQPDQHVDDLAPELTVPCSFRRSVFPHTHGTVKEERESSTEAADDGGTDSEVQVCTLEVGNQEQSNISS
jgi:hypothetical protein